MQRSNRIPLLGLLCWGAHVVVLLVMSSGWSKTCLSDALQLVIGILTVLACIQAARGSGRFGQMFWRLATVGFTVLTVGLALATYNEVFNASLGRHTWIIDLFVNAWTAPLVMCLFLNPETEPEGRDWRRILDFTQVGIVFVLLYVYTSNLALPGEGATPWRLALATDSLIAAGFYLRGLSTPRGPARSLFVRFGYFRTVAVITDGFFVLGMPEPPNGDKFDMVWSATLLIPMFIAASWDHAEGIQQTKRVASPYWRLLTSQLMPLIFPVLVLVTASQMVRGQLVVAAAGVLTSLVITYARMILTQRLQDDSQEALRQSHRLLQAIMEGANEVIFVKDLQGRYLMINTPGARTHLRTVPEIIGKTDAELFPPETAKMIRKSDLEVIESRNAMTYEFTTNVTTGIVTFLSTKSPYFGPEGELIGVIGVSLDVTERRKLEEQLRQTQKMEAIGTLSGGIAHDFNNLLTVIKGYTDLVHDSVEEESVRALVAHIEQAADRAASLTRQLLAYSRRQMLQPKVINLNDLVTNLDRMLQRLIGEDVEMKTVIDPNLGSVKADPSQIEQVIMNLAVNARDAMPQGGRLTLETTNIDLDEAYARLHAGVTPGPYVMMAVTDTGIGMSMETQKHIFEPFFTTKVMGRGTGLGLSMAYGIVKQSEGFIEVYSEPEKGTTFKIYLPRVAEAAETLSGKHTPVAAPRGTETILVVEDDLQLRELAGRVLKNCGYNVLVAESAADSVVRCEKHRGDIHLLLTDVVMPGAGGREVARQVTARRPDIKVLYMSGYTTNAIVHHGVLDASISFLQKPFTPATLAAKIREVLDQPASN